METRGELAQDVLMALMFLAIAVVAFFKCSKVIALEGTEAAIKTFYLLIFAAAALRALYFFIPSDVLEPSYAPSMVWAFRSRGWAGVLASEVLLSSGSLCLFSIFVLIIIYWADLLKKVFKPVRKYEPLTTFVYIVGSLAGIQVINFAFFLMGVYSSEAVTLVDSIELALLSMVCVVEISIFSHRFRTVLTAFGAINQVPIDSQVQTIVWITIFGNGFFVARAILEIILAVTLCILWKERRTVASLGGYWDAYVLIKHLAELAILGLMLYTLQTKKAHSPGHPIGPGATHISVGKPNKRDYQEVKDLENGVILQSKAFGHPYHQQHCST